MKNKRPKSITALFLLVCFGLLLAASCSKKGGDTPAPAPPPVVTKSPEKSITAFAFNSLSPAVTGTISGTSITLTVPNGTAVTTLVPTITVSSKATVSPASGTTVNFTNPVVFTVTAEDGSTQAFTVTVVITPPITQTIDCNNGSNIPLVWEDLGDGIDYIVKCNINIGSSALLTIKPGVRVQFEGETSGFSVTSSGALKMIGTAAKPIILEGKTASPGSWKGIEISASNIANEWEYVTVKYAGGGTYGAGLLLDDSNRSSMQVSIKNCTFSDNKGYGIWDYENNYSYSRSIFSSFENNTFTNNTKSALKIKIAEAGSLGATSSYINNTQKYIEVTGKNQLRNNITINKIDVPYLVTEYIGLLQKMTVMPGVTFEFATDAGFYIDYNSDAGSIIANGTAANPIKFIGRVPGIKGYWVGFELDNADPQISFDYCIVDGAGSYPSSGCASGQKAAFNFGGRCAAGNPLSGTGSVKNCTITNSGGYGIAYRQGRNVVLSNNIYSGNTLTDILIYTN